MALFLLQTGTLALGYTRMTAASLPVLVQREGIWSYDGRVLLDEFAAMHALHLGVGGKSRFSPSDISTARGRFLNAPTARGEAVGCGAFRRLDFGVAELVCIYSRMPNAGIGRAVLTGLESNAAKAGYPSLMVEMPRPNLSEQRFFWRMGFEPAFPTAANLKPDQGLFMRKKVSEVR